MKKIKINRKIHVLGQNHGDTFIGDVSVKEGKVTIKGVSCLSGNNFNLTIDTEDIVEISEECLR
jgi:hypothetical protein